MKTSIALIGFMGVGKTAVGRALAERLNLRFVELDELIERRAGKPLTRIFAEDGEIAFRELEIEATREVAREKSQVVACGGGLVLNRINVDRLKEEARLVLLTASPGVMLNRVGGGDSRPLLAGGDRTARVRELLAFRRPFYERAADLKVSTSRLTAEQVADEIIRRLRTDEGFCFPE